MCVAPPAVPPFHVTRLERPGKHNPALGPNTKVGVQYVSLVGVTCMLLNVAYMFVEVTPIYLYKSDM